MKISLIEPKSPVSDISLTCIEIVEPMGIASCAAVLEHAGHEVQLIHQISESTSDVVRCIAAFRPGLVGISVQTHVSTYALELACAIKSMIPTQTVFGGWHPSVVPQIVRHPAVDFVVVGEGEKTIEELADALEHHRSVPEDIQGLAFMKETELVVTHPRSRVQDLDLLPRPLREQLPMQLYKRGVLSYPPPSVHHFGSINASRGCVRNCTFCNSPTMWHRTRIERSARCVVDEIEELIGEYDVDYLLFRDEDFTTNREFVVALCEEILRRRLSVSWNCIARIDEVDSSLLALMKAAGCFEIAYGLESGSNETLSRVNKGFKTEMAASNLWKTHEAGIKNGCLFMIGFPWDTEETLGKTAEFIRSIPYDRLRVSFATPYPGTRLWERTVNSSLLLTRDLSEYTTDTPVLRVPGMSREDLLKFRDYELGTNMYFCSSYLARTRDSISREPQLLQSYFEWFNFLCKVLPRSPALTELWHTVVRTLPPSVNTQTYPGRTERLASAGSIAAHASTCFLNHHDSKLRVRSPNDKVLRQEIDRGSFARAPRIAGTFSFEEVVQAKHRGEMLRLSLMLGATCNLACLYCFTDAGRPKSEELSWNEIERLVREFRDLGGRTVSIPGEGEPTLSPYIVPLIRLLHSLGLGGIIYTNGFRLKRWLAELFYDCGCSIFVKLNSFNAEKQNWLAGDASGTYATSRDKTLGMFIDIGFARRLDGEACSRLGVVTSVMDANLKEIPAIFRFAREYNLIPSMDCLLEIGRGHDCGLTLPLDIVHKIASRLCRFDEELYGITWRPKVFSIASSCTDVYIGMCITADGSVQPCLGTKIVIGNIRDKRLADIWDSPTEKLFRSIDRLLKGRCTQCVEHYRELCYGCVGRRLQQFDLRNGLSGEVFKHVFLSNGCPSFELVQPGSAFRRYARERPEEKTKHA